MKAIIYAGIGLFAAASVYGVADYYTTQKNGTLDKLYKEEDIVKEPEKAGINETVAPLNSSKTVLTNNKSTAAGLKAGRKNRIAKKTIRFEDFSRGRIMEPLPVPLESEKPAATPAVKEEDKAPAVTAAAEKVTVKKEPEIKLSIEMFSRASLRRLPAKPLKKQGE